MVGDVAFEDANAVYRLALQRLYQDLLLWCRLQRHYGSVLPSLVYFKWATVYFEVENTSTL
jgi:hypothetical protein